MLTIEMRAATLVWDANPASEGVTNYTVYAGATKISVGTNTSWIVNQTAGTTQSYFVTASNAHGESAPSETISYTEPVPATVPASPQFASVSWVREFSGQQGLWLVSLTWRPVTNAIGYIVVREQFSTSNPTNATVLSTNFVVGTNWSASLNFGLWKVSVQSSNSAGISPRDSYVFSPSVPSRPVGIGIR